MPDSSPAHSADPGRTPDPHLILGEHLRSLSDDALAHLISARPDLGRPTPADLSTLAVRALSPVSLRWALDALDTPHLAALETVLILESSSPDVSAVAALLDVDDARAAKLLGDLADLALVLPDASHDERQSLAAVVARVIGPIAGLAPAHPNDVELSNLDLDRDLASAPAGARDVLDRLTWGPPSGVLEKTGPLAEAVTWLIDHALLRQDSGADELRVTLPRPVALHLRGGRLRQEGIERPDLPVHEYDAARIDESAGARAADALSLVDEIADTWGHDAPRVLRLGGLAVRDLTQTAAALDLDTHGAGLVLEVMRAARLLADDGDTEPAWAPTHLYDTWAEQDDALRWAELALAWRDMPRAPHRIGTRRDGAGVNALGSAVEWGALPALRREILGVLATLAPGTAISTADVIRALQWARPRRPVAVLAEAVPAVLAETELLGITAASALSTAGRALLPTAAPSDIAADTGATVSAATTAAAGIAAALRLPEPVAQVIVQADLTAIAPGRLAPHLAAFMRRAAQTESRGGAHTYRFTPDSLTHLFDDGWEADDILATLTSASATPVPQPLEYLVRDVARRHGRARIGAAGCYVRSDDVAALDAVMARSDLGSARLRRIAPTVLVSSAGPTMVMAVLREAGVSVLVESADGSVISAGATPSRAGTPRPARVAVSPAPDAEAVVATLRRAESATATDELPTADPAVVLVSLRRAVARGSNVRISLAAADGSTSTRHIRPTHIQAGLVHGVDLTDGGAGAWPASRIRGVLPEPR